MLTSGDVADVAQTVRIWTWMRAERGTFYRGTLEQTSVDQ
jgi:hypothetical protein